VTEHQCPEPWVNIADIVQYLAEKNDIGVEGRENVAMVIIIQTQAMRSLQDGGFKERVRDFAVKLVERAERIDWEEMKADVTKRLERAGLSIPPDMGGIIL